MAQQASPATREEVAGLVADILDQVPGLNVLELSLGGTYGEVRIDRIIAAERGQGHGTAAMRIICDWADRRGVVLTATADPIDVPGQRRANERRLRRFYTRRGFRRNTAARHPEYTDNMVRVPAT